MQRAANLCKWVIDVANYKLDYAMMCLNDLAQVSIFSDLVLICEDFDEVCPEFIKFANANKLAFGSVK